MSQLALKHNPRIISHNNGGFLKQELAKVGVHSRGMARILPRGRFLAVRLENISRSQGDIIKQGMLSVGGDAAVDWQVASQAAEYSGMVLLGTNEALTRFTQHLQAQPSDLSGIGELIRETIAGFERKLSRIPYPGGELQLNRTVLMGILNVTPDSFSDGGKFYDNDTAIKHGLQMIEDGADIIDIGGESTRPGAAPVSLQEELDRTLPVIKGIIKARPEALVSVDTYKAKVAGAALESGARMINDISGLGFDADMPGMAARAKVPVIIMHIQGTPRHMQDNPVYEDLLADVTRYFRERIDLALAAGIREEQIIIDPGIGFGKRVQENYELLERLDEFKALGRAIMVGPSRKSFIGQVLDLPTEERIEGTAATVTLAILKGAQIIRVHDIKAMVRVARVCDYIRSVSQDTQSDK